MLRRSKEPDEALGPVLDGHDQVARLERFLMVDEIHQEEINPEELEPESDEPQIILIIGSSGPALTVAKLAKECGFRIETVMEPETELPLSLSEDTPSSATADYRESELENLADGVYRLDSEDNLVKECNIDRNHYVCVFEKDDKMCEEIVLTCLASDAAYVGVWANQTRAEEIFEALKLAGTPDAELAAICCPMGLGIGATTPEQEAVAVVAELLAAKTGALKRLRYID